MNSKSTLPKKGLRMAHLNICSLRYKIPDISGILMEQNLHILAYISETHLDSTINNSVLNIDGYNIYRLDRNINGGGVAFYVQSHLPVRVREDLGSIGVEVIWLQIQLPHLKPVLIGCCYRPPNTTVTYLEQICEMLDRVCDGHYEIYFMGDLNIDWGSRNCALRKKLFSLAEICNLSQAVTKPTRICYRVDGSKSSSCIDLIFTNAAESCSKALSIPVGCSDHNLIAIGRRTKVSKSGQKIILKRMFKYYNEDDYRNEVRHTDWSAVLKEDDPNLALATFTELLTPIMDRHAPVRKQTVRNKMAPWLDQELKEIKLKQKQLHRMMHYYGVNIVN